MSKVIEVLQAILFLEEGISKSQLLIGYGFNTKTIYLAEEMLKKIKDRI